MSQRLFTFIPVVAVLAACATQLAFAPVSVAVDRMLMPPVKR